MSVMGFQKKSLDGEWVCGVSSIQVYFGFLEFFNFAKPLNCSYAVAKPSVIVVWYSISDLIILIIAVKLGVVNKFNKSVCV